MGRNKSEWLSIYMTRFFVFFRTTLRHFVGHKNELVELYNIIILLLMLRAKFQVPERVS